MYIVCLILAALISMLSACKGKPSGPPDPTPIAMTFKWVPGNCVDKFIVYEAKDGIWTYVDNTVASQYQFSIKPKEVRVLSVSGICTSGPLEGEWMSMEEVVAKG